MRYVFLRERFYGLRLCTRYVIAFIVLSLCIIGIGAYFTAQDGKERYEALLSVVIYDRNGVPITLRENGKGHYAYTLTTLPENFAELLIKKEDRFFYYHFGVNPLSTLRALTHYIQNGNAGGASTITQQLAKNILGTESKRSFKNKLIESIYAMSLELYTSKDDILLMYANTVFLGNQVQGFEAGSRAYFDKSLGETGASEQLSLLATLSHPSTRNPWEEENVEYARALHARLGVTDDFEEPHITKAYSFKRPSAFELSSLGIDCKKTCMTTLDATLTEALRAILALRIESERARGARNGAIVVIYAKTSELIAVVGSPDPTRTEDGGQINMALEPRPIGSTVKPLIYLKGFEEGLRPYSKVDDREYKYPIATGFPLYPKNFDGKYHGEVTLHEALSNSLNVPTVKVLEHIGLGKFYTFLSETLRFKPIQPLDSYQYGIALGGLEMDLLTLSHYFTVFPRNGTIAPLITLRSATEGEPDLPPQSDIDTTISVTDPKFVELVHAIISDRLTGVSQFGLKSNLNLTIPEYGVKTGTSRDFHDSWVIGYTPDYVVGVWLGNSENEALEQVTGQSGAGTIWHDAMEYLSQTPYYNDTSFREAHIRRIPIGTSEEWGLADDIVSEHESLLLENRLILSPHDGDTFEYTENTVIPLTSRVPVVWSINGKELSESEGTNFAPHALGGYEIRAYDKATNQTEYLQIVITATQ